jgi:hypothetical protein
VPIGQSVHGFSISLPKSSNRNLDKSGKKPLPDSNASPNVERSNEPLEDFDMSGLQPDDSFSYWAEIEEFTSSLAPLDGFDFSSVFDIGPEGLTSFNGEGDTPGQANLFSHFLGS